MTTNEPFQLEGSQFAELREARGGYGESFYVVFKDSGPRLIKTYHLEKDPSSNHGGFGIKHVQDLRGNLLASQVGGPKIFRVGLITLPQKRTPFFFIEMALLFPDSEFRWSLKHNPNEFRSYSSPNTARFLSEMITQAIEERIQIRDLDVLMNEKRELKWVDGDFWSALPEGEYELREYFTYLINQQLGRYSFLYDFGLLEYLKDDIQNSSLDPEIKHAVADTIGL